LSEQVNVSSDPLLTQLRFKDEYFKTVHENADFFQRTAVSPGIDDAPQVPPKITEAGPMPPLPIFNFQVNAAPWLSHTFPFADRGNSWVKVAIEPLIPPPNATNLQVECRPLSGFRHIISVTVKIIVAKVRFEL
jgi:hypothetical protein